MSFWVEFKRHIVSNISFAYPIQIGLSILFSVYFLYSTLSPANLSTPNEKDTRKHALVELSIAGTNQPNIFRYINVKYITSSSLSPEGRQLAFLSTAIQIYT